MSFVHQDLGLAPSLTVVENLRVGEMATSRRPFVSWRAERRRARAAFARYGLAIDPAAQITDLRPVERALVAIVRAMEEIRETHEGRGILILDEPTVFLPREDVHQLFGLVRDLASGGASVIFVSHDLDEVHEITDRVTVLRDGRVVGTRVTAEAGEGDLVEMIIGRRLAQFSAEHRDLTGREPLAIVRGLAGRGIDGIDFDLHAGEVLGLTGLVGSGFEDVPYLLFGAGGARAGEITAGAVTQPLKRGAPSRALRAGMALIPGDRQRDGAVGSLSVGENVTLPVLRGHAVGGLALNRLSLRRRARGLCADYDVRPADPSAGYGSLSGGNQQKALLAKWLQIAPKILLLHEPTQGVDVGARQQIYERIRLAAADGAAVLCASSDFEQLATICDRVLVIARGRIASELVGEEVSKERLAERCYASTSAERAIGEAA